MVRTCAWHARDIITRLVPRAHYYLIYLILILPAIYLTMDGVLRGMGRGERGGWKHAPLPTSISAVAAKNYGLERTRISYQKLSWHGTGRTYFCN